MYIRMKNSINIFFTIICILLCSAGCASWQTPTEASADQPEIFPDYRDITVPSNIAPLNFMVEGAGRIQATFSCNAVELLQIAGKDGVIEIPLKKWHALLSQVSGGTIDVNVSVWNAAYAEGIAYAPFKINVANEQIDPWIAYRLIEPGYRSWRQLGLYQRDLSSFEESVIVSNATANETCLNCHHFPSYSSESMMFHARGANGGTVLYHDGQLKKIKFNEIGPKKNTTYPAWHPEGRFIAFSSNTTRQIFFVHGENPIEVFDTASDLVLYDTKTGNVHTDPRFMTNEVLETFPAWSPDGKYLYFVSAQSRNLPADLEDLHYDLVRVSFDPETATFGDQVEVIYDSSVNGGSVSWPRISADGRYVLYTWAQFGTFPIWHHEADLQMIDLQSGQPVDVSIWNDKQYTDSYHSWSSNGRWVMFGSRRLDGRYTRVYIAYLSEDGTPCKPFLLPQEDPRHNMWRLKSYNVPEFLDGDVELPEEVVSLFEPVK